MNRSEKTAKIFKALCDQNRVEIINLLKSGNQCACHIGDALHLAQSKLSYHMKILCESGIVDSWSEGKWTRYQISESGCKEALLCLEELLFTDEEGAPCCK